MAIQGERGRVDESYTVTLFVEIRNDSEDRRRSVTPVSRAHSAARRSASAPSASRHDSANPVRPDVSGLPKPRAFRRSAANRANSISRVLSGCNSKPNREPLAQIGQEPLGLVTMLEARHVVVGEANENHIPARASWARRRPVRRRAPGAG